MGSSRAWPLPGLARMAAGHPDPKVCNGPAALTARDLGGSDGQADGTMGEFQRIIHAAVPESLRGGPR
jgi:hypothetical protein